MVMLYLTVTALFTSQGLPVSLESFISYMPDGRFLAIGGSMLLITIVVVLIITTWLQAGWYSMMRAIAKSGTAGTKDFFMGTKEHFKNLLGYKVIIGLMWAVVLIPLAVFLYLVFITAETSQGMMLLYLLLFLLFLLFTGILALAMLFCLAFAPVMLVNHTLSPLEAIKGSFRFLKESTSVTLLSAAVIMIIGVAYAIIANVSDFILSIALMSFSQTVQLVVTLVTTVIYMLLQLCIWIFTPQFLFDVYEERQQEIAQTVKTQPAKTVAKSKK